MKKKVYFTVFVLSFSRYGYVSFSLDPINTSKFIAMHNEAFRYFGGIAEECVYDQTKLVCISEKYREVILNDSFYQFASRCKFGINVCEGYDPESKGKVESGVKYVKNNFIYGEEFASYQDFLTEGSEWLNNVANKRIHGTTKRVPLEMYEKEEKAFMKPYVPVAGYDFEKHELRKADKTSLISYNGNKYSAPMSYQGKQVMITESEDKLIIKNVEHMEIIAVHGISFAKGKIIKNLHHYRDVNKKIKDYEDELKRITDEELGEKLSMLLKKSSPKIYKDQLAGMLLVIKRFKNHEIREYLKELSVRQKLKVTFAEDYLNAKIKKNANEKEEKQKPGEASKLLKKYEFLNKQKGKKHEQL